MEFGMPTLIEQETLEETVKLCNWINRTVKYFRVNHKKGFEYFSRNGQNP